MDFVGGSLSHGENTERKKMKRSLGLLVLVQAMFAAAANAQSITITFSGITAAPAPGTWMLMGLGLLLAFFVFRKAHSLPGGRASAVVLMLVAVSAYEIFTGHALLTKASAIIGTVIESITGGGSITVNGLDNSGRTQEAWVNNTGSSITITSVTPDQGDNLGTPPNMPQCVATLVVASGGTCYTILASVE
jgi:hypothetical protein